MISAKRRKGGLVAPIFAAIILLSGCGTAAVPSPPPIVSERENLKTAGAPSPAVSAAPSVKPSPVVSAIPSPSVSEIPKSPEPSEAERVLSELTLEEKVGQMFFAAFRRDAGGTGITSVNADIAAEVTDKNLGGIILFSENIETEAQTVRLIADYRALTDIPLFVGADEEGGSVSRTGNLGYPRIPSAGDIGETDAETAYGYGETVAGYLAGLGFNVDFAPVADINTNPNNPVIGRRAFGKDADAVSAMVVAFMSGLRENGVMSAVKHFPGHGDTNQDSHSGFASVTHDIDRLRAVELVPFQAAIDAGADFVMVGHISAPNITGNDEPAIFSRELVTDLLRGEMGFDGIIITDAMDMGAVTRYYSPGEAAVKAILAGIDMALMPEDLDEAYNAVIDAVNSGVIGMEIIDGAVLRILEKKYGGSLHK